MAIIHITEEELQDFDDEAPTEPLIRVVQRQLNAAHSILGFAAAARDVTSSPKKRHWTEDLERRIDQAEVTGDDTGPGWAGRVAR